MSRTPESLNAGISEADSRFLLHNPNRPFDYLYHDLYAREHQGDQRSKECIAAQEASLTSAGGVTIVALPALYDREWYTELPLCAKVFDRLEMAEITRMGGTGWEKPIERLYLAGGEAEVFDYAQHFVEKHRNELERTIGPINLHQLTPDQAIYLAGVVVRSSVEYDYAAKDDPRYRAHIKDPQERAHVDGMYTRNRKAYVEWLEGREALLDGLTTMQRLKFGKAICRHYAEDTAKMFYALKLFQEDLESSRLSNVDMFSYCPTGEARDLISDDDHAYNIVLVRIPKPGDKFEAVVSVMDTTWNDVPEDPHDYDQTIRRLSSAVGFVRVAGYMVGIEDPLTQALGLTRLALGRFKTPPRGTYFNDYFALMKFDASAKSGENPGDRNIYSRTAAEILRRSTKDSMGLVHEIIKSPLVAGNVCETFGDDFYREVAKLSFDTKSLNMTAAEKQTRLSVVKILQDSFFLLYGGFPKRDFPYLFQALEYRNMPYVILKTYVDNGELPDPQKRKILDRVIRSLPTDGPLGSTVGEEALIETYKQMESAAGPRGVRQKITSLFG